MKIALLQREDARDIKCHSGVYYFMAKALEKHVGEVIYVCPDDSLLTTAIVNAARLLDHMSYALFGRHISSDHHRILSKRLAGTLGPRLAKCDCDVIFAPNGSVEIANLSTSLPIVYRTDMNWVNIVDYYPGNKFLFDFSRAEGDRIEAAAISKASALIYPSDWAARSATEHYKADARIVHSIPSGVNFQETDVPSREVAVRHSLDRGISLLWVGVNWERKGGSIAYDCLLELLRKGIDARLVVCGCVPPKRNRHPKVQIVPRLSKTDPVQRRRLSQLFLDANFFLFPTQAEAFGIVLSEASAHGLPSLVRDTGGVRAAVTDGENGYLLPPDADGKRYAEKLLEIVQDGSTYERLVQTSRRAYEERLNWDAWGRAVKPIFERIVEKSCLGTTNAIEDKSKQGGKVPDFEENRLSEISNPSKMRIGIVSRSNVADVRALSGVPYFMAKALQNHVGEVIFLGPDDSLLTRTIENAGRALNRVSNALFGRHISSDHHRILSRRLAHTLGSRAMQSGCDVLFAPTGSVEIAYLPTSIPTIYCSDMSWADMADYYPGTLSLFEFARREGDLIDGAAIGKACASIFPSVWAARTAIEFYKGDSRKVYCIPNGANFEEEDIPSQEAALQHSLGGEITLLWVGIDWQRKGGDVAYDCLLELLRRGRDARLVVCGCVPPKLYRHPKMVIIPFLNKRDPEQRRRLSELFLEASFFLFPTMAEAYGIVLCEASAHGLPSLVRDTGGVGGAVVDGENGYLLPPDATGKQYAEKVLEIVRDRCVYDELVRTSRMAYEERLNWDAWGRSVKPIFMQAAGKRDS